VLAGLFVLTPRWGILSPAAVANDGRWVLWEMAWRVFRENPWFGAGAGQYNAAFRSLGLTPAAHDPITISHPHNLYLDMLYAHGLVGFIAGMIFLFGFLYWGYRRIRPGLLAEWGGKIGGLYWRLAAAFWVAYAGWLVNGIFGHDFYRTWWLGLAMSYLGIMAGAAVNGLRHPGHE
jgi:O-antigen ligase